ncbi:MAG: CHAT domain-containing tetratricopeptide repeat protein [Bacteroidota bacterium]
MKCKTFLERAEKDPETAGTFFKQIKELKCGAYYEIKISRLLAKHLIQKKEQDSAKRILEKTFIYPSNTTQSLSSELAGNYILMSEIAKDEWDYEKESEYLEKAMPLLEDNPKALEQLGSVYLKLGNAFRRQRKFSQAEKWFKKAEIFSEKHSLADIYIKSIGNLGLLNFNAGKLSIATGYYQNVMGMIRKSAQPDYKLLVTTHNNLGNIYETEFNIDSALFHYHKAIALIKSQPVSSGWDKNVLPILLNNVSLVYIRDEQYDLAYESANKSFLQLLGLLGEDHPRLIYNYGTLGKIYTRKKEFKLAEAMIGKALRISKANGLKNQLPSTYNDLGMLYLKRSEFATARHYFDSAISKNVVLVNGDERFRNYDPLFFSIAGLVEIAFKDPNPDYEVVEALFFKFKKCLSDIYLNFNLYSIITNEFPTILEQFFILFNQKYEETKNEKWLSQMWEIAELNKSVKLRRQLKEDNEYFLSIPEELVLLERKLVKDISKKIGEIKPNTFDSTLFNLTRQLNELKEKYRVEYPDYYNLKMKLVTSSIEEARRSLNTGEAILNFFEGKENSYLLKVSGQNVAVSQLAVSKLDSLISFVNDHIQEGEISSSFISASSRIKEGFLMSSLKTEGIKRLLIIPDGKVWALNFTMLPEENEGIINYFGNEYAISFDFFFAQTGKTTIPDESRLLAFSYSSASNLPDDRSQGHLELRNLSGGIPGTSKEVRAISEEWTRGDYYFGNKAIETVFKTEGSRYAVLHLATHSVDDEYFPENSYVQFAGADSVNDSRLYAYELYNLQLAAELVVLSSCNSGKGKISSGEGMKSLGRAFRYAGAKSVLASRWEVPDATTPIIMKYFYEGLNRGMRKSESLSYAQNKFLELDADVVTKSPFYWAGFYVIGNDNPLFQKRSLQSVLLYAGILTLMIFTFVTYLRKRK